MHGLCLKILKERKKICIFVVHAIFICFSLFSHDERAQSQQRLTKNSHKTPRKFNSKSASREKGNASIEHLNIRKRGISADKINESRMEGANRKLGEKVQGNTSAIRERRKSDNELDQIQKAEVRSIKSQGNVKSGRAPVSNIRKEELRDPDEDLDSFQGSRSFFLQPLLIVFMMFFFACVTGYFYLKSYQNRQAKRLQSGFGKPVNTKQHAEETFSIIRKNSGIYRTGSSGFGGEVSIRQSRKSDLEVVSASMTETTSQKVNLQSSVNLSNPSILTRESDQQFGPEHKVEKIEGENILDREDGNNGPPVIFSTAMLSEDEPLEGFQEISENDDLSLQSRFNANIEQNEESIQNEEDKVTPRTLQEFVDIRAARKRWLREGKNVNRLLLERYGLTKKEWERNVAFWMQKIEESNADTHDAITSLIESFADDESKSRAS